jgi:hypothetical protein
MKSTDQKIHELLGKCWHEGDHVCKKCRTSIVVGFTDNPSYTTDWAVYGPMLVELRNLKRHKKWLVFVFAISETRTELVDLLFNPLKGCEAIVEFFCKET